MTLIADVFPEILAPKKKVKAVFQRTGRQTPRQMGRNTAAI